MNDQTSIVFVLTGDTSQMSALPDHPSDHAASGRRRHRFRRLGKAAGGLLTLALLVAWAVLFLPQGLGGRASFVGVNGVSMTPTMRYGDLALVERKPSYHMGDIIAYRIPAGQPGAGQNIIHRIVGGNGTTGFTTKGDHNSYTDAFWHPTTNQVIGRVWFHLPGAMRWMVDLHTPIVFALVVGFGSFALMALPSRKREETRDGAPAWSSPVEVQVPVEVHVPVEEPAASLEEAGRRPSLVTR